MIARQQNPATDRPTIFVLLGVTGDLARRLVVPALFELHQSGGLPQQFLVLGLGRYDLQVQALSEGVEGVHVPEDRECAFRRS